MPLFVSYIHLLLAIVFEIFGTTMLVKTEQFSRLWPSLLVMLCYSLSFYFLSLSLKLIPVGIAYALWSAVGIVSIAVIGYVVFKQSLDAPAMIGMGLIIAGVIVIHVFSDSVARH